MLNKNSRNLTFHTISKNTCFPEKGNLKVYLKVDNWEDFGFKTLYEIVLFDEDNKKYELGYVKIANFEQTTEKREELADTFKSYESLHVNSWQTALCQELLINSNWYMERT